jgi:DNA-binding NarL/FixJ family response regulator
LITGTVSPALFAVSILNLGDGIDSDSASTGPDGMKAERSPTSHFRKIKVLLVDDHALVRRGFRHILEDEPHITVVGEASDGAEAVQMVCDLEPRVVLMDFAMPKMNGLLATRQILQARPEIAILMLSMHSEDSWVREAIETGVRGYLLKNAVNLDLGSAIARVAAGEFVLDAQLSDPGPGSGRDCELSPRELEILRLIVGGKSNKEIAAHLSLSENTVGVHRANIMRELGIHKTAELVVYAIRNRLVSIS